MTGGVCKAAKSHMEKKAAVSASVLRSLLHFGFGEKYSRNKSYKSAIQNHVLWEAQGRKSYIWTC